MYCSGLPWWLSGKESACHSGDMGLILGLGRSPGDGNGNPLQYSLGLTGWILLQSKRLSRVFSKHHSSKASIFWHSAFFTVQLSHPYMTTGKTVALTRQTFVGKVKSLLFNMLPTLVSFSSMEQVSFNFMAAVTICSDFGAQKNKV